MVTFIVQDPYFIMGSPLGNQLAILHDDCVLYISTSRSGATAQKLPLDEAHDGPSHWVESMGVVKDGMFEQLTTLVWSN